MHECLDDFIDESNPLRVIDVFVDTLDLVEMNFEVVEPLMALRCERMDDALIAAQRAIKLDDRDANGLLR